jgi:ppGpp synthetase/RelA/SpoT-type nucleotidyltranferase
MSSPESFINQFVQKQKIYSSLEQLTNGLISTLISNDGLEIHSISSRVKSESSLLGKITKPDKNYKDLNEITDLVGVRITTYFSDHVDLISEIISREFKVDDENSIDKRKALSPDRFGYMSLHLVVEHSDERTKLPEYENFKGLRFEVQIRTILQHAWAEIEHDIGYKSKAQVPQILRRRFSRLSGLLELADEEFFAIRNEIEGYKNHLESNIAHNPSSVLLDLDSLESFVNTDAEVIELEKQLSQIFECEFIESHKETLSPALNYINALGISTIDELKEKYQLASPYILNFVKHWLDEERNFINVRKGISLLYVAYVYLGVVDEQALYNAFLSSVKFGEESKVEMPKRIKSIMDEISI